MRKLIATRIVLILIFIFLQSGIILAQNKTATGENNQAPTEVNAQRGEESSKATLKDPNALSESARQAIIEEIKAQLATMASKPLMQLIEFCQKNEIVGEFVVDLTVEGKGKIVTVFMVSTPEIAMPKKNALKDKLTQLSFENIKIPKKERVKLRYTLKF